MNAELPRVLGKANLSVGSARHTLAEWLDRAAPDTLLYRYVTQQAISLLVWEILNASGREFPQKLPLVISMVVPRELVRVIALRDRLVEPVEGQNAEPDPLQAEIPVLVLYILEELGLGAVEPFMVNNLVGEIAQLAGLAPARTLEALTRDCVDADREFLGGLQQQAPKARLDSQS